MSATIKLGSLQPVHEDGRRAILEQQFEDERLSIQRLKIKDRVPLGNHYHRHRREVFVVLVGRGTLSCAGVGEDGRPGAVQQHPVGPGAVFVVPPYVAHAFVLAPGSELLCFSDVLFDEADLNEVMLVETS